MIASLRRIHFRAVFALAAFLPAALAAGWWSRPDPPAPATLPDALAPWHAGEIVWSRDDLFAVAPVTTRLLSDGTGWVVELSPRVDLRRPDVLVYWTPDELGPTDGGGELEPTAHFLGRLGGTRTHRFALPPAAHRERDGRDSRNERDRGVRGSLVLYSLGHQEWIDRAVLDPTAKRTAR